MATKTATINWGGKSSNDHPAATTAVTANCGDRKSNNNQPMEKTSNNNGLQQRWPKQEETYQKHQSMDSCLPVVVQWQLSDSDCRKSRNREKNVYMATSNNQPAVCCSTHWCIKQMTMTMTAIARTSITVTNNKQQSIGGHQNRCSAGSKEITVALGQCTLKGMATAQLWQWLDKWWLWQ